jgi:hypothetical protein
MELKAITMNILRDASSAGGFKKTGDISPIFKKGDELVWIIRNEVKPKKAIKVDFSDFDVKGLVEIDSELPITIPPTYPVGLVHANVVEHVKGKKQKVSYVVLIDDLEVDPDLIVDGGPGIEPKGNLKRTKRRGGKKRASKNRGSKKR